jgi:hypothetical protein
MCHLRFPAQCRVTAVPAPMGIDASSATRYHLNRPAPYSAALARHRNFLKYVGWHTHIIATYTVQAFKIPCWATPAHVKEGGPA